jgi:hypothetical protein
LLGGPRDDDAFGTGDGAWACAGGVEKRGGLLPSDSLRADDRAEVPGPGSDDCCSVRPASGVWVGGVSSSWAGVGIWRRAGVPAWREEGTGEPNRAVDSARGIDCDSAGELRPECCDEGTARGVDASGLFAMTLSSRLVSSVEQTRASVIYA